MIISIPSYLESLVGFEAIFRFRDRNFVISSIAVTQLILSCYL